MATNKSKYSSASKQNANSVGSKNKKPSQNYFGCNSYSGSDMVAIMTIPGLSGSKGTYVLGSLQTLSISTNMQRTPIRSIGNVNAKDYVMGPRTIAGSLVFAVFDKHFAYEAMEAIQGEIGSYTFLADELPPFDITVTMANEYGKMSKLVIYGVRLVNEGQVMSINDIYIENTYQFVARDYDYLSDKTGATSDYIYEPLTARVDSTSDPIEIIEVEDIKEDEQRKIDIHDIKVIATTTNALNNNSEYIKGSVSLTLNTIQKNGYIELMGQDLKSLYKFDLATNPLPVTQALDKGQYHAKYINLESEESETCDFTIKETVTDNAVPSKPILLYQKASNDTYLVGVKSSDDISKGICYVLKEHSNDVSSYKYILFNDKRCELQLLKNKIYNIMAYNGNKFSEVITLYTNATNQNVFDDFKTYIVNNRYNIPSAYYNQFETIWTKLNDYIKLHQSEYIVSKSLNQLKKQLTDYNIRKACDYFIIEAIKYENEFVQYNNQDNVVSAPIIIDQALSIIQMTSNVRRIVITGDKYPVTVGSGNFTKKNNAYTYQLNMKPGFYTIVAYNAANKESAPINIMVYDPATKEELLSKERSYAASKEDNISLIATRNACFDKIIHGDKNYLIYNQLLYNTHKLSNSVAEPIIEENASDRLVINVDYVNKNNFFLCLDEASELNLGTLVFRVNLNKNTNVYTFLSNKYALVKHARYCLWIEDNSGNIISNINSFEFGVSDSPVTRELNQIILKQMKDYFKEYENKTSILSYNEDDHELNPYKVFDEIIIDRFDMLVPNAKRKSLIIDAVHAKCDYYTKKPTSVLSKVNVTLNNNQIKILTENKALYTDIIVDVVKDNAVVNYDISMDNVTLNAASVKGLIIKYSNSNKDTITRPIIIDLSTKAVLNNAGAKVEVKL